MKLLSVYNERLELLIIKKNFKLIIINPKSLKRLVKTNSRK